MDLLIVLVAQANKVVGRRSESLNRRVPGWQITATHAVNRREWVRQPGEVEAARSADVES